MRKLSEHAQQLMGGYTYLVVPLVEYLGILLERRFDAALRLYTDAKAWLGCTLTRIRVCIVPVIQLFESFLKKNS